MTICSDPKPPFSPVSGGIRVALRVTPRARRAGIAGIVSTPNGTAIAISVTVPPEDGKANEAMRAVLAEACDVPKSAISLIGGAKNRNKLVRVAGDSAALCARLDNWLKQQEKRSG